MYATRPLLDRLLEPQPLHAARGAHWRRALVTGAPLPDVPVTARGLSEAMLRRALRGEPLPPAARHVRCLRLHLDDLTPAAVEHLLGAGLLDGLTHLTLHGGQRRAAPRAVLDAAPRLRHLVVAGARLPAGVAARPERVDGFALSKAELRALIESGALDAARGLSLRGLAEAPDAALWAALPLERLSLFELDGRDALDRVLARLSPALHTLSLWAIAPSVAQAAAIGALPGLRRLSMSRARHPAPVLAALGGARLDALDLGWCHVDRAHLDALGALAGELRALDLSAHRLDGAALRDVLAAAPRLEALAAGYVEGADADRLAPLAEALTPDRLRAIDLSSAPVDDRVGCAIRGPRWEAVDLRATAIGRPTAAHLLGDPSLVGLRALDLSGVRLFDLARAVPRPVVLTGDEARLDPPSPRPALVSLSLADTGACYRDPDVFFEPARWPALVALDIEQGWQSGPIPSAALARLAREGAGLCIATFGQGCAIDRGFADALVALAPGLVELSLGDTDAALLGALAAAPLPALERLTLSRGVDHDAAADAEALIGLLTDNPLPSLCDLTAHPDEVWVDRLRAAAAPHAGVEIWA